MNYNNNFDNKRSFNEDNNSEQRNRKYNNNRRKPKRIVDDRVKELNPLGEYNCNLKQYLADNKCDFGVVPVSKPVYQYFENYLTVNKEVKRIAVIGFGLGYTTEMFLNIRNDITVFVFDDMRGKFHGIANHYLAEHYKNRHIFIGGDIKENINILNPFMIQERFDLIYIDGNVISNQSSSILSKCQGLCYEDTSLFMDNLKPFSKTGIEPYKSWNTLATNGQIKEEEIISCENLNRCIGYGYFVTEQSAIPLDAEEKTKIDAFWNSDPNAVMWKYGYLLENSKTYEEARKYWDEMEQRNIKKDKTAYNLFIRCISVDKNTPPDFLNQIQQEKDTLYS